MPLRDADNPSLKQLPLTNPLPKQLTYEPPRLPEEPTQRMLPPPRYRQLTYTPPEAPAAPAPSSRKTPRKPKSRWQDGIAEENAFDAIKSRI